jgi:two-component system sensor kinase FixL
MAKRPDSEGKMAQATLAAVVEWSDDAIITETADGVITGWNKGAERIFGYTAKEMIGKSVRLLAAPCQPDDVAAILERALRGEQIAHHETTRRHKNGAVLQVSLTVRPILKDQGGLLGLVKIARDITAEKNTRTMLREGEAQIHSIIEAIPDGMVVMDERGIVQSFSPAAERMFGHSAAEVCGRNVKMLMPSPDRERHDSYLERYRMTGERRIIGIGRTVQGRRKDGSVFPMDLAVGESKSGNARQFIGFVRDVTQRQETDRRLLELQTELVHVARISAMGEMATTLAHELNQPLTAVTNYAEAARQLLAGSGFAAPEKVTEFMAKAAAQAERAGQIIRRLRGFVEKREVERTRENLNEVVQEAAHLATIGAKVEGVEVNYELADELPPILVDRTQIQQVVVNLVRNAIEVLRDAERRTVVISTVAADQGQQEVAVADSGPGILPAVAERLFQPFVTSKKGGMGIGLAVSRSIIEAHGGRLWAESGVAGGAVFRFRLLHEPGAGDAA